MSAAAGMKGEGTVGEILSKCGFRCDICPAYTENIESDEDRAAVSRGWKRLFGFEVPPDRVECAGCNNEGQHADTGCPVRPCAIEMGVENCAYCTEFECGALRTRTGFLKDYLKNGQDLIKGDYERYIRPYESRKRLIRLREGREDAE
jgi:hypothetical protein